MSVSDDDPNRQDAQGQSVGMSYRMVDIGRDLLLALVFLTRLPAPRFTPGPLRRAVWAFPLIGVLVGAISGLAYGLGAAIGLGPLPAATLGVAAGLWVTGALHEDGLADTADGLGGGRDREAKLMIMRDSRIGVYGMAALVLALVLKIALIAQLAAPGQVFVALIGASALSRAKLVVLMYVLKPARADGRAAEAGRPSGLVTFIAFAIGGTIQVIGAGFDITAQSLVLGSGLVVLAMVGLVARRQIGGQTGDILGAAQVTTELALLAAFVSLTAPYIAP